MSDRSIQDVLDQHSPAWMRIAGVIGTAIGLRDGQTCLVVYVRKRTEELAGGFPAEIGGHRVVLEESGHFERLG